MDQRNNEQPLDQRLGNKAEQVKEDLKGTARRAEGEIRDDEGLKQEHEPSIIERAAESVKTTAQAAGNKVSEAAQNIGLTSRDNNC